VLILLTASFILAVLTCASRYRLPFSNGPASP
jgi:hypothetical protein